MIRRFNRFELKYVVSLEQREALLPEIRERMLPDPQGGAAGAYRISSLYFDTQDLAFFRSKLDGIKFRRKLRIRVYGDRPDGGQAQAMVEIKQRIDRTVQKRRVVLPLEDAYVLCAGGLEEPPPDPGDAEVAGEVAFLVRSMKLAPTCVISYSRQAFMGSAFEPGLRLTFDRELCCAHPAQGLWPDQRFHFLPSDRMILEVKADEAVPLWVVRLLARHSIALRRYSKYCAGLAHLRERPSGRAHG